MRETSPGVMSSSNSADCGGGAVTMTRSKWPSSWPSASVRSQVSDSRSIRATARLVCYVDGLGEVAADLVHAGGGDEAARAACFSDSALPSNTPIFGSHWATMPARSHASTYRRKRSSRTVKYWAPWSKRVSRSSTRRVDIRPPGPRPLSKTVTGMRWSRSVRAQNRPLRPAPMTATRGGCSTGGRWTMVAERAAIDTTCVPFRYHVAVPCR